MITHLIAVFYSIGFHHYDEHFQILEFIAYELDKVPLQELSWEYEARVRPAIQPFFGLHVIHFFKKFGVSNPDIYALFFRFLSGLFSFVCGWVLYKTFQERFTRNWVGLLFLFLSFLTWYFPYLHVRYSAEVWSINFFVLAFCKIYELKKLTPYRALLIGLFLGFSFVVKYQSGVLITGALFWLLVIGREKFVNIGLILLSVATVYLIFGVFVDYLFYGEWVCAPYNYFKVNILENKTSEFGTSSWWFYFHSVFHKSFVPIGLITIVSSIYLPFKRPKHLLTWVIVPYVFLHFIIGHKELRFLFPIALLVPLFVCLFFQDLANVFPEKVHRMFLKPLVFFVLLSHSVLLPLGMFRPAKSSAGVFNYINSNFKDSVYVNYKNDFGCLNWRFYTMQQVIYNEIDEDAQVDKAVLKGLNADFIYVSSAKLSLLELSNSGLVLDYQTYPNWVDARFIKKVLKFGPVWYVYVPQE